MSCRTGHTLFVILFTSRAETGVTACGVLNVFRATRSFQLRAWCRVLLVPSKRM